MVMQSLNTGKTGKLLKFVLLGLLVMAAASLVLTDVGGFFRGGVSRQDVARVGSKHISIVKFFDVYRRSLQQNGMQDATARQMGVPYMILQQEMTREMLLQAAHKNGIRIDNAYVARSLKSQLDDVDFPGVTDARQKLAIMLQQQGMDERSFVDLVRGDFAANLFNSVAVGTDLATPEALSNALFQADKEERVVTLTPITAAALKNRKPLTDADLKAYFEEHKERYRTAERRDIAVAILPKTLFMTDVNVSDEETRAYYDDHKEQFQTPERVRFSQLIVSDKDQAKDIAKKKPTDLSTLKADGVEYLASDWYGRNNLPKELQNAVYGKKQTGLIGPVETALGSHILIVETFQESQPESFDKVKEDIARLLKDQKLDEQMTAITEKLDSFTLAGQGVAEIAKEYKVAPLSLRDIRKENLESKIAELKLPTNLVDRVKEAVFAQDAGETNFIETQDGSYAVIEITEVKPSVIPNPGDIKAAILKDALVADQQKAIQALADKIIGSYKANDPAAFSKLITESGLRAVTLPASTRSALEKSHNQEIANLAFALTNQNRLSFANSTDGIILVQLQRINASKQAPSEEQRKELDKTVQAAVAGEINQQLMQAINQELGAVINYDLMKQQFSDPAAQQ